MKLLQGNVPIIFIQETKDGQDEWRDFSGDRILKGGKVFDVYSFDDLLDDGLFDQVEYRDGVFLLDDAYLGGSARWIWDENARIWWSCEWVVWRDAVILCRREYHSKVAMISASQGGRDVTRIGFEFIFEMVECLIYRFPADFG